MQALKIIHYLDYDTLGANREFGYSLIFSHTPHTPSKSDLLYTLAAIQMGCGSSSVEMPVDDAGENPFISNHKSKKEKEKAAAFADPNEGKRGKGAGKAKSTLIVYDPNITAKSPKKTDGGILDKLADAIKPPENFYDGVIRNSAKKVHVEAHELALAARIEEIEAEKTKSSKKAKKK